MSEERKPTAGENREISDLIGVELTLALMVWFLVVLAAFFLIGVVVGVILIFAGVIRASAGTRSRRFAAPIPTEPRPRAGLDRPPANVLEAAP